jgi:hypothetical protein
MFWVSAWESAWSVDSSTWPASSPGELTSVTMVTDDSSVSVACSKCFSSTFVSWVEFPGDSAEFSSEKDDTD